MQFFVLTDRRPGAPATLPELLDRYADIRPFGGFVVAWVMFGSSGHIARPHVRRGSTIAAGDTTYSGATP